MKDKEDLKMILWAVFISSALMVGFTVFCVWISKLNTAARWAIEAKAERVAAQSWHRATHLVR